MDPREGDGTAHGGSTERRYQDFKYASLVSRSSAYAFRPGAIWGADAMTAYSRDFQGETR